jgi:hypothetical protein
VHGHRHLRRRLAAAHLAPQPLGDLHHSGHSPCAAALRTAKCDQGCVRALGPRSTDSHATPLATSPPHTYDTLHTVATQPPAPSPPHTHHTPTRHTPARRSWRCAGRPSMPSSS